MANSNGRSPEDNRKEVEGSISALLTAFKDSMTLEALCKEYEQICGKALKPEVLGFQTMDQMLRSMPNVLRVQEWNGKTVIKGVPKDSSQHIKALVMGQKPAKRSAAAKRGRGGFGGPVRPHFPNLTTRLVVNNSAYPKYRSSAPWNEPDRSYQQATSPNPNTAANPAPRQQQQPRQPYVPPNQRQHLQQQQTPLVFVKPEFKPMQGPPPVQQQQANKPPPKLALPIPRMLLFKDKLYRLVQAHQLGEVTYDHSLLKNGKYVAQVEVKSKKLKVSCYPDEFDNIEGACEAAAKLAFQELEPTYRETAKKKLPETSDVNLMTSRIVELVAKSSAGYWSEALGCKYAELHGETLPIDWVDRVMVVNPPLVFDKVGECFTICMAHGNSGSRPQTPQEPQQSEPVQSPKPQQQPQQQQHFSFGNSISDFMRHGMVPTPVQPGASQPMAMRPIAAQVTDSDSYRVQVCSIRAGDNVGVRLQCVSEQDHWDEMMNEMEIYYSQHHTKLRPVENLVTDRLYVGCHDGDWCRLEYIGSSDDPLDVIVTLVDYPDVETMKRTEIFPLEQRFALLPKQGLMIYLEGLSPVRDHDNIHACVAENLLGKSFTAQIVSRDPQISVVLFSSDNVNMNEFVVSQVADKADSVPLKHVGGIPQTVAVSYVSPMCHVYVLRDTPQQRTVESLTSLVALRIETVSPVRNLIKNGIYMGLSKTRASWCRMKVLNATPAEDGTVMVELIDYGQPEQVSAESLRDLSIVSPALARLPGQAAEVLLARIPPSPSLVFSDKAAKRLREIAPAHLRLWMRVIEFSPQGTPVVELYERIELGKLAVVNTTLEMDSSLYELNPQSAAAAANKGGAAELVNQRMTAMNVRHAVSSPSPTNFLDGAVRVPPATLPQVSSGRTFHLLGVRVFNVVSPSNFYIHETDKIPELSKLTASMMEVYGLPSGPNHLDAKSVQEGGHYAWLHHTTHVYERVEISQHLGSLVSLLLLDRGEIVVVQVTTLRPLLPEFARLPAQALQAKLHGVKPTEGEWTTHNVLYFRDQVNDKCFNSHVMEIVKEGGKDVLSLRLLSMNGQERENGDAVAQKLIDNQQAQAA